MAETGDAGVLDTADLPAAVRTRPAFLDDPAPETVAEMREWLRRWVMDATGLPAEQVTDDRPMEEMGLASRDAIAMSGDIEDVTGVLLTAMVAYQHPTIASLAKRIIDGEPEAPEESMDDSFYTNATHTDAHEIAIVGLATRFPKAGHTPDSTWEFLIGRGDAITDLPEGRWDEFVSNPQVAEAVKQANVRGGYLDDVKSFDPEFFSMSPMEAEYADPQQRLVLELTWEALEHAHIPASELKGKRVGVFIGASSHDMSLVASIDPLNAHPASITGAATSIIANRVSYFYDFRGPSVALDTACSSTMVAVHQAVRALRNGEADYAIAGGVNMLLAPAVTLGFDSVGAVAPDGKIKAFSSDANGMVRSEGGGLVVLRRIEDAQRDGDNILAVIVGTAVNSDGRSNGMLAPNPDAQADCLRQAYRDAGLLPTSVDYVEAHGTGTILGDPIEADALGRVLGRGREADKPLLIGSVKTNFGHLESGAGAASLAKVIMSFQHNTLPATINYAGPNPYIPFEQTNLAVVAEQTDWPRYSGSAVAGISGFGFGGTNAHLVLREPPPAVDESADVEQIVDDATVDETVDEAATPKFYVLPVSALMPSRRRAAAGRIANWLESEAAQGVTLDSLGRTLASRNHARSRGVVLASTIDEAIAGFRTLEAGKTSPSVYSCDTPVAEGAVWVFGGFGSQHRKMGKQLYLDNEHFRASIDEVDELIEFEAGYSVKEMILDDSIDYNVGTMQTTIFAIQVGTVNLLRSYGVEPAAVIGHSMGEVAAAYASGGLKLEDAVRVICSRSKLMGEGEAMIPDEHVRPMALLEYSAEEIEAALVDYPDLEVAVYAAPTHTVIGGPKAQVEAMAAAAEKVGKMARVLPTRGAGHTSMMDMLLGELAAELVGLEARPLKVGVISTVDREKHYRLGDVIHGEKYWLDNMRHSVWFTQAVRLAINEGYTTFVEISPHPVALMQVAATAFANDLHNPQLIETLKRKDDEPRAILATVAQSYVYGHSANLRALYGSGEYADVPRTEFNRKHLWTSAQLGTTMGAGLPGAHVALPDGRHAWEIAAAGVTDVTQLVAAAAAQVMSDVAVGARREHAPLPTEGSLTTTLSPHLGGGSVQVHARQGSDFTLIFEAAVQGGEAIDFEPVTVAPIKAAGALANDPFAVKDIDEFEDSSGKFDPNGPVSVEDHLAEIIAEAMGYEVEDIPVEVPLIDLGMDSLMAVRIKNRVEYEFGIPPLQIQAVRDANLRDVGLYLRYAVENPDDVKALAEAQAAERAKNNDVSSPEGMAAMLQQIQAQKAAKASGAQAVAPEPEAEPDAAAESELVAPTEPESAPESDRASESDAAAESKASLSELLNSQQALAEAAGSDVPPRDAAERLTFATWAVITGESAKGIFNTLPVLDENTAEKLAVRLSERCKGEVTVDDVLDSESIEELADVVRQHLEGGVLDGVTRTLRARPDGSDATPVFVFHPAGGSTVVYEPLLKRLPADTPMYGLERVQGSIEERARQLAIEVRKIQGDGPYVLAGWSFGGILALGVAKVLKAEGADVRLVAMLDTALPKERPGNSPADRLARVQRYADFAKRTYGIDAPLPVEELAQADDDQQISIVMNLLNLSGARIPGGVIEHQRTSWIENREMMKLEDTDVYDGTVVVYLADRYHDDAIALEPTMGDRAPDGGWRDRVTDLVVVPIGGEHLQIVDEPYIGRVGADLTKRLEQLEAGR